MLQDEPRRSGRLDRYRVLEAKDLIADRRELPITLYLIYDTQEDAFVKRKGQRVDFYSEDQKALAYDRATALNALERQLAATPKEPSGLPQHNLYCCQLFAMCYLSGRPAQHARGCPTQQGRGCNEP